MARKQRTLSDAERVNVLKELQQIHTEVLVLQHAALATRDQVDQHRRSLSQLKTKIAILHSSIS